ncbi:hypothetical protein GGS21DRAFT_178478 [Xylaria nigripes]|nr:hypothetical protein GGS21DRAFT_178478 [Xylaria nigripes]
MTADNRGPELAAVTGAFLGLSAITVLLRCYVRLVVLRIFRPEDYLAAGTLMLFIAYTAVVSLSIEYGAGKHTVDVPKENIPKVLEMRWVGEIIYVATAATLKLTVGVFLLRICSQMWHKVTIWIVLVVCVVFNTCYFFLAAFQCRPVRYFWEQYTNASLNGSCLSFEFTTSLTYTFSGINAAGDWFLALLPVALVRNLELGRRQKISIAGILAIGIVASAATIVRVFYVWQIEQGGDVLYEFTDFAIWSTVENGLGLIASSVVMLRPLFKKFLKAASQYAFSQQYAIQGQSANSRQKFLDARPATGSQNPEIELYRQNLAARNKNPQRGDDDNVDDDTPLYSSRNVNTYLSDNETRENYHNPLIPREVSARFRDGLRPDRPEAQLPYAHGHELNGNVRKSDV